MSFLTFLSAKAKRQIGRQVTKIAFCKTKGKICWLRFYKGKLRQKLFVLLRATIRKCLIVKADVLCL